MIIFYTLHRDFRFTLYFQEHFRATLCLSLLEGHFSPPALSSPVKCCQWLVDVDKK